MDIRTLFYHRDVMLAVAPLVVIGIIHRQISARGAFLLVVSHLPITIMHELAHFATAIILGGRPTGFSLWPQRVGNKWRLGSVTASATLISAAPTALAPLVWFFVGLLLLAERSVLSGGSLQRLAGTYLTAYLCFSASILSWQDIKVALSHPISLLLWAAAAVAADRLIS